MKIMKFATAVAFAIFPLTASAEPIDFGSKTVFGVVGSANMSKDQKSAYRSFRGKSGYFGAMYTNDTTDYSYWVWGFHTMGNARKAAKADCELLLEVKVNADCLPSHTRKGGV